MQNSSFQLNNFLKKAVHHIILIPFWLSSFVGLALIIDFGYEEGESFNNTLFWGSVASIIAGFAAMIARYLNVKKRPPARVWLMDGFFILVLLGLVMNLLHWQYFEFLDKREWLLSGIILIILREFSALNIDFKKKLINPAQLFILSFMVIILSGTLLLMLPKATHSGISFIDALFTSTSAVCVTGLVVVDTGSYFTQMGQIIILVLIQIGGLGIMTFTSYFSYFFRGGSSYETQLLLKDMTSTDKIADVFATLKKILLLTFLIEGVGLLMVFVFSERTGFSSIGDQLFFSLFHSVSAFCNAGFSTLSNSLYDNAFRFNYPLQLGIATLFILGGIGFPIIFNFFKYLKYVIINRIQFLRKKREVIHVPWIINLNTRIVVITTAILIVTGTMIFYWFEYDNTLKEHSELGKIVTAFFGAVTPRTAGFNTIDTATLNFSTIMFIFLLMWIGASPGSTGGGIKTSTFAIGTLNYLSIARGKDRMELFTREVADISIRRAFAIISLSLAVIGAAVFLIASFDHEKELLPIAFECFSAYSTVGLSLGITADLNIPSKLVIITTMFIGRVSMLTILIAFLRKVKYLKYRYPTEEILIN